MNINYLLLCLFGISVCFLNKSAARDAIIGGSFAKLYRFPYQASILLGSRQSPSCGAGVIRDRFVLTAADCFHKPINALHNESIRVCMGTDNLDVQGTIISVKKIYIPKQFYVPVFSHHTLADIAALELEESLALEHQDSNLDLPENEMMSYDHQTVSIAGFGWDKIFGNGDGINIERRLRFADALVHNRSECHRDHPGLGINEGHICARVKQLQRRAHRGVCIGDTGGLLVFNEKIAIGILSKPSRGCKEVESSAVYTNVAHYRRFILQAVNNDVTEDTYVIDL